MPEKVLVFPRATIMPNQATDKSCFAATAIGILEYYAGRQSTKSQAELTAWHNQSRAKDKKTPTIFGSVSYILKKFGCFAGRENLKNTGKTHLKIYQMIRREINADRPVVIQINDYHCGIAYGYNDDDHGYIYATDPDPGNIDARGDPKHEMGDFLYNYRQKFPITALIFTKKGAADAFKLPSQVKDGIEEPSFRWTDTLNQVDEMLADL